MFAPSRLLAMQNYGKHFQCHGSSTSAHSGSAAQYAPSIYPPPPWTADLGLNKMNNCDHLIPEKVFNEFGLEWDRKQSAKEVKKK